MVAINKMQRKFLEEIVMLKSSNKKWHYNGMTVTCISGKSRKKTTWVEDSMICYISPDWFREISLKYHGKEYVEAQIRQAKWYLKEYEKRVIRDNSI